MNKEIHYNKIEFDKKMDIWMKECQDAPIDQKFSQEFIKTIKYVSREEAIKMFEDSTQENTKV